MSLRFASSPFLILVRSPVGKLTVSPADKDIVSQQGIAVVDCSWAQLDSVPLDRLGGGHNRLRMSYRWAVILSSNREQYRF